MPNLVRKLSEFHAHGRQLWSKTHNSFLFLHHKQTDISQMKHRQKDVYLTVSLIKVRITSDSFCHGSPLFQSLLRRNVERSAAEVLYSQRGREVACPQQMEKTMIKPPSRTSRFLVWAVRSISAHLSARLSQLCSLSPEQNN